jgi:pimeloyl-ACP methyl ester carboxylesterase
MIVALAGCSVVGTRAVSSRAFLADQRSDVLNTSRTSDGTRQVLSIFALDDSTCRKQFTACAGRVAGSPALTDEQRTSTLAELWLEVALLADARPEDHLVSDVATSAYLEATRYAYAYLFFTRRHPEERVFEMRQIQVIDFYNFAVQRLVGRFFEERLHFSQSDGMRIAGWTIEFPHNDLKSDLSRQTPTALLPSQRLAFNGLRNTYRRDGFGATFVAEMPQGETAPDQPWREPAFLPATVSLTFPGDTLSEVLAAKTVIPSVSDPYASASITVAGHQLPLGANFTAPYGVWLSGSNFARESIRNLFGRGAGNQMPNVYLMQPYDPTRETVVMIHGLASSPEAWVNVANEIMGDEDLRKRYQIWEVYYPTDLPIPVNLKRIRDALNATFAHFDPEGSATASRDAVLIGHSMGGVIGRLLVSRSNEGLWKALPFRSNLRPDERVRAREKFAPYLQFEPMSQFDSAIFLAAPQRGTPFARLRIARWLSQLIRAPADLIRQMGAAADYLAHDGSAGQPVHVPSSIDSLSDNDPFIVAAADLPLSQAATYHVIVGQDDPGQPLVQSSDGLVPYSSAHMAVASSELVVHSGHSVQETPEAIVEIRRILREHAAGERPPIRKMSTKATTPASSGRDPDA